MVTKPIRQVLIAASATLALAGCVATSPMQQARLGRPGAYDPKYGVWASAKMIADGQPVPRGGGTYLVGRPYVVAGRTYYPSERPFSAVGTASWYGAAFQGRRTANGEIFDRASIAAAHPTMPLPSYARVTNLRNNRSIIVRVNDRGPYAAGRVMDVSERVAEVLDFKSRGTSQVKVEYVGRASLEGSDDEKLLATLRTDGSLASLDGVEDGSPIPSWPKVADASAPPPASPEAAPAVEQAVASNDEAPAQTTVVARNAPLPPTRPFDLGTGRKGQLPMTALALVAKPGASANPLANGIPLPVRRPGSTALNYVSNASVEQAIRQDGMFEALQRQPLIPLVADVGPIRQ